MAKPATKKPAIEDDAIQLLEAFCSAAVTDRYRRNNGIQNLARMYQADQHQIRGMQDRLDARMHARAERDKPAEK